MQLAITLTGSCTPRDRLWIIKDIPDLTCFIGNSGTPTLRRKYNLKADRITNFLYTDHSSAIMISVDFSLAVISSILFALCFAAPLQDIGFDISYEKDPPGRGTITILWSCVFTFALCTWTSVHPNILPPGSTSIGRLKYKLLWMSFAMLFPHGIMLCAFGQWREAKRLHRFWLERFEINVQNQYDHMGIEGGFFLLMGGFTLPKGELEAGEEDGYIPVLTPYGFVTYVQAGMIDQSSFDRRFINDKGKASSVAKLVTLVQAGWLIFQCVTRVVAGLPITLLEIHVANQVLCAAVSYFFWWHKPLDVNEPMEIGLKTGAVPRPLSAEQRQQLEQPELVSRESVYYSQSGYEITEKSRSGLLVLMLRAIYDISEFLFGNDTQAKLAISNNTLRNGQQGWMVGRFTRRGLTHETVVENEIRMGDVSSHSNESASIDISSATPATRDPAYTFINWKDTSSRSNTTSRTSISSQDPDTSKPRNILDKLVVGIFLISGGGFHLTAWNVPFPTNLEWLLWIISCMGICLGSLFLTAIFLLTDWEKQYLRALWETRFYDHGLLGHMRARLIKESRANTSLWKWMNIYISWFLVFLYVLLSIFITVESFLHLRRLSAMFYQTPVWDGYWPHISG